MTADYVALGDDRSARPIVAIDLGYSESAASCGVAGTGLPAPLQLTFGRAVSFVAEQLTATPEAVLVCEAVLSMRHLDNGNPTIRGEFERGRGWYWGPGAVSALAARRFLGQLSQKLSFPVCLAEAFLSNKVMRTAHRDDAANILLHFWAIQPETLRSGVEPILHSVVGVPPVRVFRAME